MISLPQRTVLVTCVGGRLIYDILHALRNADDFEATIIGVDADPKAHGRLLCDRFVRLPMAEEEPEAYNEQLKSIHAETPIDVLLALSEGEVRLIAEHREELIGLGINVSVSSYRTVETMTDKLLMLQCLARHGIHTTPFAAIDDEADLDAALRDLGYGGRKVVVKPRYGRGSRGVLIVDRDRPTFEKLLPERFCGIGSRDAVLRAMQEERMELAGLIAVPYVGGVVDDVDCIATGGVLTDFSARRRQLRNPLWPTSTGHKIVLDPAVRDYATALCEVFEVEGAADFDIATDDDDRPVLFDSGARFSGSVGGSYTAGGNFPAQLVRVLTGLPRRPMEIRDGVVLRPYITMAEIPEANEEDLL